MRETLTSKKFSEQGEEGIGDGNVGIGGGFGRSLSGGRGGGGESFREAETVEIPTPAPERGSLEDLHPDQRRPAMHPRQGNRQNARCHPQTVHCLPTPPSEFIGLFGRHRFRCDGRSSPTPIHVVVTTAAVVRIAFVISLFALTGFPVSPEPFSRA